MTAHRQPRDQHHGQAQLPHRRRLWHGPAAYALVVACIVTGVGWVYVLRDVNVLALGPNVTGALPLQQLAGSDDQPLLRLVVVWGISGLVAGRILAWGSSLGPRSRSLRIVVVAAIVLFVAGAVSDAATISDPLASHLTAQFSRAGTWVAVVLMGLGSLAVADRRASAQAA